VLFAGAWGMKVLLPNSTIKGLEQGQEGDPATTRSYRYAQSTTGAVQACMGWEPRDSSITGGMTKMIC